MAVAHGFKVLLLPFHRSTSQVRLAAGLPIPGRCLGSGDEQKTPLVNFVFCRHNVSKAIRNHIKFCQTTHYLEGLYYVASQFWGRFFCLWLCLFQPGKSTYMFPIFLGGALLRGKSPGNIAGQNHYL